MNITTSINPINGSGGTAAPPEATKIDVSVAASQVEQKSQEDKEQSLSVQEVKELAEGLNELMDGLQTSIGFSIHEKLSNQVVVEIKDRQTDQLIKQIPSEELLAIKEKMEEFTGMLFDQKA
ncbi:MAG: flagellar protein FlaG [Desulfobacter sp.]|nr:MAG: flagellar protein FlaG [Desulfobacter sp.]